MHPIIPADCVHNAHMYYVLLPSTEKRAALIEHLKSKDIHTVFHYIPLHDSEMGLKFGRTSGDLAHTTDLASRLLRLPLWLGMEVHQEAVVREIGAGLTGAKACH